MGRRKVSEERSGRLTLLDKGMVLIAGARDLNGLVSMVELYDPSTGTFTVTGSLNTLRSGHKATLLPNGQVLIPGGVAANYLASAEL